MQIKQILLEYNRDITAQRWGQKILGAGKWVRYNPRPPSTWSEDGKKYINTILEKLEAADPTPNKQYVQALVRWFCSKMSSLEDLTSRGRDNLIKFDKLKKKGMIDLADRDIGKLNTLQAFETVVSKYPDPESAEIKRGKAELVYADHQLRIIHPFDQEAACYYGQGTRWCTAAKSGNRFSMYNEDGPLYIIIPKNPEYAGEKYQFHFQSQQFMNEVDEDIDLFQLADRYPQLRSIFKESAKVNNVIGLLYQGLNKETLKKVIRQAMIDLVTDSYSETFDIRSQFYDRVVESLWAIWRDEQWIRPIVGEETFTKCRAAARGIMSKEDLTFNWLVELLARGLNTYPDGLTGPDRFNDYLYDSIEDLSHEKCAYSDAFQPIIDAVYEKYGNDGDELMDISSAMTHNVASRFSPVMYAEVSKRLTDKLAAFKIPDQISEATYKGNIGAMETVKFYQIASPAQKKELQNLLRLARDARKRKDTETYQTSIKAAWGMIQQVTNIKLKGQVFNESILLEGGNVFKNPDGTPATDRIFLPDILPTVKWLEQITGLPLVNNMLGTTGKKESSGDLDLAVDASQINKDQLAKILTDWATKKKLDPRDYVRKSGDSVHFKAAIGSDPGRGFVQVDFMLGEPVWQQFAMAGGGPNSPFKGMHRQLLMSSIAKALGLKWSYKYGLVSRTSNNVITKDPDYIAEILLGPGASRKDLQNVETIFNKIQGRSDFDEITQQFKADLDREGLAMPQTINTK